MPSVPLFENFEQLLGVGEHDAVLIATPMHKQVQATQRALEAGLHVLVEKPGGLSVGDAIMMRDAANRAKMQMWVGYNRRFRAAYQALREHLGRSEPDADSTIRYELGYSLRDWKPVSGIDPGETRQSLVVFDVAAHQLDLMPWLFGGTVDQVKTLSLSDDSPGSQKLEFALRLTSGIEASCNASHRKDYRETLEFVGPGQRALAFPTGILISRRLGPRSLQRIAAMRNWIERKLIRLGLRADDLSESYARQLDSFGAAIGGGDSFEPGVDAGNLPQLHASLKALKQSMRSPGGWVRVDREG